MRAKGCGDRYKKFIAASFGKDGVQEPDENDQKDDDDDDGDDGDDGGDDDDDDDEYDDDDDDDDDDYDDDCMEPTSWGGQGKFRCKGNPVSSYADLGTRLTPKECKVPAWRLWLFLRSAFCN